MLSNLCRKYYKDICEMFIVLVSAFIMAVIFRTCLYEIYVIPSGSMKSSFMIGDFVWISKYNYGINNQSVWPNFMNKYFKMDKIFVDYPSRGDVVILRSNDPRDSKIYIKRVIGLPGDSIEMLHGNVLINDKIIAKKFHKIFVDENEEKFKQYIETLPEGLSYLVLDKGISRLDNMAKVTVPDSSYFLMGDNRDQSNDSRLDLGMVKFENIIGKAQKILISCPDSIFMIWRWPFTCNYDRLFIDYNYVAE